MADMFTFTKKYTPAFFSIIGVISPSWNWNKIGYTILNTIYKMSLKNCGVLLLVLLGRYYFYMLHYKNSLVCIFPLSHIHVYTKKSYCNRMCLINPFYFYFSHFAVDCQDDEAFQTVIQMSTNLFRWKIRSTTKCFLYTLPHQVHGQYEKFKVFDPFLRPIFRTKVWLRLKNGVIFNTSLTCTCVKVKLTLEFARDNEGNLTDLPENHAFLVSSDP